MAYADTESYEQMIQALQTFLSGLQEQCQAMKAAGEDCLDNTDQDDNVRPRVGELQECVGQIQSTFGTIEGIIQGLQQELQRILESGSGN